MIVVLAGRTIWHAGSSEKYFPQFGRGSPEIGLADFPGVPGIGYRFHSGGGPKHRGQLSCARIYRDSR